MPRNLVLCCDGTSNRFAADRTNVLKLCYALRKDADEQLVYYHPGIGTRAPVGVGTAIGGFWAKVGGLAFGLGLQADVADAYIYLMNHYQRGDRVFLFGFSRGAYTARVIASMLKLYGLALPGNEALVPYAVEMLWAISKLRRQSGREAKVKAYFDLAEEFRETLAGAVCKPHFMGVWDTVNSVGWINNPLMLPFTRDNPDIAMTRHAIAIDEHRAFFRVNWFAERAHANIKQVWFPGSHGDVGGGHPEAESGLSKCALEWMAREAGDAGLLVDRDRLAQVLGLTDDPGWIPAAPSEPHPSVTGAWHIGEFVPKPWYNRETRRSELRMNRYRRRTMPDDAVVHDVAWQMPGDYAERLPPGAIPLSQKVWDFDIPKTRHG